MMTVTTMDALWMELAKGRNLRCVVLENGDTPVLTGPFQAVITH